MIFDGLNFAVLNFTFVIEIAIYNMIMTELSYFKLYELCHKLTEVCFTKRLLWMF